jgi:hypothetical protein
VPLTKTHRGHHRAHLGRHGQVTGTCLIVAAFSAALLVAPSAASARSEGSSGALVLRGFLSGRLNVPAFLPPGKFTTGCQISPAQAGTVILQWDMATLTVNGKPKTLNNIDVQVTVQSFGHRYSMNLNSYGESPATITFQSNMPFGWSSVSGTLTTTKSGGAGSVSGTMTAGKQHPGTVSIKGNWAGCAKLS